MGTFYKVLSGKLLLYKNNLVDLISKVRTIYEKASINMLILERYNQLMNIDSFTNFYCLIKLHIRMDCKKFFFAVGELFYSEVLDPTSFNFISVLNNQDAIFYYFIADRDDCDIEDL